jgi:hypothetical protein
LGRCLTQRRKGAKNCAYVPTTYAPLSIRLFTTIDTKTTTPMGVTYLGNQKPSNFLLFSWLWYLDVTTVHMNQSITKPKRWPTSLRIIFGTAILVLALFLVFAIGIALGPVETIREKHKEQQGIVMAQQLAVAFGDYQLAYGYWPTTNTSAILIDPALTRVLQGANPKGIIFMEISPRLLDSGGATADRWGRRYWCLFDQDGDGLIVDPLDLSQSVTNPVLVWATDTHHPTVKNW